MKPTVLIIDVDGVMTTGQVLYSADGKEYKIFGAHDSDGLKLLHGKIKISFITADKRGYPISKKRIVDDMGFPLHVVPEADRLAYFEQLDIGSTIFIGDGYHDAPVLRRCGFGIAPVSARREARAAADFVTASAAGHGAVLDACLEVQKRFFSDA